MSKTKGSTVLEAVKLLRSRRAEALALLPPALHPYLDERIGVASWYPEDDLLGLIVACAGVFPVRGDTIFEVMGAHVARTHLEGIYSDMLERDVAARARALWKTQHDTGELRVAASTPTSATYELVDWELRSPEYCRLIGGYFAELHRLSGAASPTCVHSSCRAQGAERCVWLVRYG